MFRTLRLKQPHPDTAHRANKANAGPPICLLELLAKLTPDLHGDFGILISLDPTHIGTKDRRDQVLQGPRSTVPRELK